jgi:hypothetical protein
MKRWHVVDIRSREYVMSARGHAGAPSAAAALGWRASRSAATHQRQLAPGVGPRRQCRKVDRAQASRESMSGWLIGIVLSLSIGACSAPPPPETKDYAVKVAADRAAKDALFQAADDPIPKPKHAEFLPLAYFPIDPDYDVPAQLKTIEDRSVMEMPTSTGTLRKMRRVGTLEFSLKGQPLKLTAFVEADARTLDRLFVPFNDLTSVTETYPGGRYMDLDRTTTGIYKVDFNRAYHPYCYFNPTYECPIPPSENRLKIPVRAGEKLKKPNT